MYLNIRYHLMVNVTRLLVIAVFSVLSLSAIGQANEFNKSLFTRIAQLQGLKVKCILKDSYGFMWFGTETGLYRFDGYNTELINSSSADISLSSDLVLSLYEDRKHNLWIGTGNGLQQLSADRRSIKTFLAASNAAGETKRSIHAIAEMSDGSLWCSSLNGSLYRSADKKYFSPISNTFNIDYKNASRIIATISEDENHNVWVADNLYGFQKLNLAGEVLDNFLRFNSNTHIACFVNKSVRFYADQQKVYGYSSKENEFVPLANNELVNLLKSPVRHVYQDKKGYQWLVTQSRLIRFDPRSKKTDDFTDQFTNSGASFFQIECVYEDDNNQLWFGSYFGVYRLNNQNKIFKNITLPEGTGSNPYFSTRDIHESAEGDLYIGSYSGFFKYNKASNQFKEYKIKRDNIWVNPLPRAIVDDAHNNLWLATEGNGLLYFDTKKETFTPYLNKAVALNKTGDSAILSPYNYCLLKDAEGQLWLGGYNNLYKINAEKSEDGLFNWESDKKSLSSLKVMSICQSRDKTLWIGTDYGLYKIEKGQEVTARYASVPKFNRRIGLTNDFINCIYEDGNGSLWLGTKGGGINVFNPVTGLVEHVYSVQDGLADDRICEILPGAKNELWVSTYNGLSRLDLKTKSFRNFFITDGLPTNKFNQGSALKATDGKLYFGSMNGIVVLDTATVLPPLKESGVMLIKVVQHNGEDNKVEENAFAINSLKSIKLHYNDRFFTVYFALKNYYGYANEHTRFAYKIDGIADEWQDIGTINYIQFAGLPPGNYLLKIKGMGSDGIWGKKELHLPVLVKAAFYATTAAYIIYTIAGLSILFLIYRFQMGRIRLKNNLRLEHLENEKLQELDEMKSRFFTNITHEFRTPLTLIISPLEQLLEQPTNPPPEIVRHQHNVIYRNAQRLLRLINQLLDAAKLEAGNMKVLVSQGNPILFIEQIVESFRLQADKKEICLDYLAGDNSQPEYLFDMEKLEKIVYNLVSNALKFTPKNGRVQVKVSMQDLGEKNILNLQVFDTGKGIAAEQLSFVFDRFYQADESSNRSFDGSGLGLFLVKELIELMGGEVQVKSKEEQGTVFTVTLPLKKVSEYFSPLPSRVLPVIVQEENVITYQQQQSASENDPLVLVVEDHDELRNFIVSGLAQKYRVLTAKDGKEAWQLVQQELPDLVITDVTMPEMDGFTLSQLIKNTALTTHIAVILLTARASSESRVEGLTTGANDYLTKPFNLQELHLRLANLLNYQDRLRRYWQQKLTQPEAKKPLVIADKPEADDPFLLAINQLVDRELDNTNFTVEQMAREMTVSTRTLHRKLSSITGMNASELIRTYRLSKAAVFLKEGHSVSEAAYKVGFEGLSYFSKCFKEQFDVSPSEYTHSL